MNASLDKRVGMRARYGLAGNSAGPRAERSARSVARGFGMPKSIHRGSRMLALPSGRKGLKVEGLGDSGHRCDSRRTPFAMERPIVAVLQNGMLFLGVLSTAKGVSAVMTHQSGRLAQLGERCVRNAEVGGSIPPPSTKLNVVG
jgi:hypothetical protein